MNTRTTDNGDPAHAPERNLSSLKLRPVSISLAIAAQAARAYGQDAREACLWLANLAANSQRIQLCWQLRFLPDPLGTIGRITEAEICEKVGLDRRVVYSVLTGGGDDADLSQFVSAVKKLRANFEEKLPLLVKTADSRSIAEAFDIAGDRHQITIVQGKTRQGKTEEAQRLWLKNLHDTIWVHCPTGGDERTFLNEFARALGIGANISKRVPQLRQQIKNALGIGLISRVVIDEAHKLWPKDLANQQPVRVEFVRELRDQLGVGFILLQTEQGALALEIAKKENSRWSPGQFAGRRYQFELRDSHTDKEIKAIVTLHAGAITEGALDGMLAFVKAEEGYLGAGIEALLNARHLAGSSAITETHVALATRQQQTNARVKALALGTKPARRGRLRLVA